MTISIVKYLSESHQLILESEVPKDTQVTGIIKNSENYKKLIQLAKKHFTIGLNTAERKLAGDLIKDDKVQSVLITAERVGQRKGWFKGGILGSILGGTGGLILTSDASSFVLGLVLLGAAMGGITLGYLFSKVMGVLNKWKAEDEMSSGRGVRIEALA